MAIEIKTINTGVNCYLLKTGLDFFLIDTGFSSKKALLVNELENAGCNPGNLKLIILTHGDIDHTGNCAYLREKYGTKIVMHNDDTGMAENGDMSLNRKNKPDKVSIIFRLIGVFFGGSIKYDKFKPDIIIEGGQDLSEFGYNARIIHIPGHSKGSIGILTAEGSLFCGDLLINFIKPGFHFYIDSMADAKSSIEKLSKFKIDTVYPGHGRPFIWEKFLKNYHKKNNKK